MLQSQKVHTTVSSNSPSIRTAAPTCSFSTAWSDLHTACTSIPAFRLATQSLQALRLAPTLKLNITSLSCVFDRSLWFHCSIRIAATMLYLWLQHMTPTLSFNATSHVFYLDRSHQSLYRSRPINQRDRTIVSSSSRLQRSTRFCCNV